MSASERTAVTIGTRRLSLSNLDKVLWPRDGYTKGDLIDYYRSVAGVIVPEGEGRWIEYAGGYSDMLAQRGADLTRELSEGLIVPALIGSAERDHGVMRLLKALRHEVPEVRAAAARSARGLFAAGRVRPAQRERGDLYLL